jgi:thioredoxin reductase (NADPH)
MSTFPLVIIGAGPAGIATAIEAINRGYKAEDIIMIERAGEIAHMIKSKYPDEKPVLANYKGRMAACLGDMCITDMSKKEFFDYLEEMVKKFKLQINFNQQVTKVTKLRNGQFNVETNLDAYTCSAVFVAIGTMAAPRSLGVSVSQEVAKRMCTDIQKVHDDHQSVLVVGGGDSAAEYAKILCDRGHQVVLSYRGQDFSKMIEQNAINTKKLIMDGKITYFSESQIEKLEMKDHKVCVSFLQSKYPSLQVSSLVVALGTERPTNYLNSIGISTVMESKELFSESKTEGLFFVGDLAIDKSGGSINFAFNSGVNAISHACDNYLDCPLPQYTKKAA